MSVSDLVRRRDRLAQRLLDGERRIQQAEAQGNDVFAWETFWLDLLKEYEQTCDEIGTLSRQGSAS